MFEDLEPWAGGGGGEWAIQGDEFSNSIMKNSPPLNWFFWFRAFYI